MSDPKRVLSRLGSLEDEIERLHAINAELRAALEAAKRLCDNMNEFGACTDAEIYDAADTAIRAAIAKARGE